MFVICAVVVAQTNRVISIANNLFITHKDTKKIADTKFTNNYLLYKIFIIFVTNVALFQKIDIMKVLFLHYQQPQLREIEVVIESGFVGSMENPTATEDIEW